MKLAVRRSRTTSQAGESRLLLAALAMAASMTFRGFAGILAIDRDRARAEALLAAGLEVSGGILSKLDDKTPLTERDTLISLSTGAVRVHMSDETGRIDINTAPPVVLAALLRSVGAGEDADTIAQAIDAWRARDQADQAQAAAQSKPKGQSTTPATDNGFRSFTDLRQLLQIPGMRREWLGAILPLTTVFGSDKVNALTASADVLAALPNAGPAQIDAFLGARARSVTGDRLLQMLGPANDYVKGEGRPVASVILTARLLDGYMAQAYAVVTVVPDDKRPYRVLAWTPLANPAGGRARMAERREDNP